LDCVRLVLTTGVRWRFIILKKEADGAVKEYHSDDLLYDPVEMVGVRQRQAKMIIALLVNWVSLWYFGNLQYQYSSFSRWRTQPPLNREIGSRWDDVESLLRYPIQLLEWSEQSVIQQVLLGFLARLERIRRKRKALDQFIRLLVITYIGDKGCTSIHGHYWPYLYAARN
jgi:hypothetical protein